MFGREKRARIEPAAAPSRRHGRRPIRSSLTGPQLPNPDARTTRFELAARGALELLRHELGADLDGVRIGFATVPLTVADGTTKGDSQSEQPLFYSIDRASRTIELYRMPIQRAKGLHVDDDEHRRYFVGHCVHRAVCEYLGREPWEVAPGRFEHF